MKIGVIADPPLVTHSCAVVAGQLAKQWVRQGHEVHYLGYGYKGEIKKHKDGYNIYPDTVPLTQKGSVLKFNQMAGGLDILYAHGSKDIFVGGIAAAKELGIPYVPHTFYNPPMKTDKVTTFECRMENTYLLYDCAEVDDMFVCNNFSAGVGYVLGKRTWFVPNGIDEDIFYPEKHNVHNYRFELGIPQDAFVFLFSGSNLSGKDPGRALDCFALFWNSLTYDEQKKTYLAMHTRPGDKEGESDRGMVNLRATAKANGVGNNVKFFTDAFPEWLDDAPGYYSKTAMSPPYTNTPFEQMGNVYRTGDVQIATTLMEGMSTTILEGQACGLPIICSDDVVVSEPVIHFVTGLLVRRHLTHECIKEEVVQAMKTLYEDHELLNSMGKAAASHMLIKYNWKHIARQFIYHFETLSKKHYA